MTRAKFRVASKEIVEDSSYDSKANVSVTNLVAKITLQAVTGTSDENKEFFKSTPSGSITINIVRLETAEQFEQGKEVYVDFTPAN